MYSRVLGVLTPSIWQCDWAANVQDPPLLSMPGKATESRLAKLYLLSDFKFLSTPSILNNIGRIIAKVLKLFCYLMPLRQSGVTKGVPLANAVANVPRCPRFEITEGLWLRRAMSLALAWRSNCEMFLKTPQGWQSVPLGWWLSRGEWDD